LAVGGWRLAVGGWRLAVGGWRLAVGGWRLAVGGWRLAVGGWRKIKKYTVKSSASESISHFILSLVNLKPEYVHFKICFFIHSTILYYVFCAKLFEKGFIARPKLHGFCISIWTSIKSCLQ
jgi:hypothetical protein